ncbi:TetR/AcrR family transcriptional regulator [Polyangium sp. 6x1]|uniref:TetR/AcrR family transcriptional regulator n=1 Tax=Polyangium sp. 6x1 TaxID=3042689 RepID=UPI002482216D|nr:TetR/AcrR family transcriptional regulator [Polyangium sp. 6x1]MDI1452106.1 TetR/AcrR family transcriptional regulator [Polyangium sp. 6x1]
MPRRPPRPYHHGDLPRALREGALALIEERGPMGFTLRELARRVGVSHAAPYRHFADKRALLTALAAEGAHRLADAVDAALTAAGPDLRARFLAAAHAYVRFAMDHPGYFQAMFSTDADPNDPAHVNGRERSLGLLYRYIAEAQAAGYFGEGEALSYVIPVFAMHQGLAVLAMSGAFATLGMPDIRAASDLAHGRLLDGLTRAPEAKGKPRTKA